MAGNYSAQVKDGKLVITVDLAKELGPSSSGKTTLVASSGGFVAIPGTEVKLNLTATKK